MAKGSTSKAKPGKMSNLVNRKGGQTAMMRELAAQRKAGGAAQVARAMKNWGLKPGKANTPKGKAPKGRGGKGTGGGRNG